MRINRKIGRLAVLTVSMLTCLALAATAFASDLGSTTVAADGSCSSDVTIPSSTEPGVYDIEVTGEVIVEDDGVYPPSSASASTDANEVFPGETVTVFCSGFAPGTTVTFHLALVALSEGEGVFSLAQVTEERTVRTRIRVLDPDDFFRDEDGRIIKIVERIVDGGGDRTIVVNNSSSSSSSASAAASGGGGGEKTVIVKQAAGGGKLVRTGVDALPLAAAAMAALLLGTVLLGAARRRRTASDS